MPTIFTMDLVSWALLQGYFTVLDFHLVNKSHLSLCTSVFVLYYIIYIYIYIGENGQMSL